jgi:hypothetical protein
MPTRATHWKPKDWPFEDLGDDPIAEPLAAAREYLHHMPDSGEFEGENYEDLWQDRFTLEREGEVVVELEGCERTTDLLPDHEWFDGYEPGCGYWRTTGEALRVRVRHVFEVLP